MADSRYIFDYLNDVWELLPEEDQIRFGETWKAYEQSYGYVWMQQFDLDLANQIRFLPLYNTKRWLKHLFNDDTRVLRSARFQSSQDFSRPINLSNRYLIRLSVDSAEAVQIDLRGTNPLQTSLTEIITSINAALGASVAFATNQMQVLNFRSLTSGPESSLRFFPATDPARDASAIVVGIDPEELPQTFPQFPHAFQLAEREIVGIPELQDKIHDELVEVGLTQDVDFSVEFGTGIISFAAEPPEVMWAKDTLVNYETPYNNFGYLMGFYDRNTPQYLRAVKGLWYAFWNGPRPENIRRSLYLIFGLPTASKNGEVTAVTPTQVALAYDDGTEETFEVPVNLIPIVSVGARVTEFQPLVSGINVFDKINYPGFVEKEVGRIGVQPFLTQHATLGEDPDTDESRALRLLEENTYLPQIDVNAFVSPDIRLENVKSFLTNIQPKHRTFLLQILVGTFRDELSLKDEGLTGTPTDKWPNGRPSLILDIDFDATGNIDWNNNTMGDQETWDDAEDSPGTGLVLDDAGLAFGDYVGIEVYEGDVLIDSFTVEG